MKIVVMSILLLLTTMGFSQEITYTKGFLKLEKDNYEKNIGKNVTVKYDEFFKNYQVFYTDQYGDRRKIVFEYAGSKKNVGPTDAKEPTYTYNGRVFYNGIGLGIYDADKGEGSITFQTKYHDIIYRISMLNLE